MGEKLTPLMTMMNIDDDDECALAATNKKGKRLLLAKTTFSQSLKPIVCQSILSYNGLIFIDLAKSTSTEPVITTINFASVNHMQQSLPATYTSCLCTAARLLPGSDVKFRGV